MLETTNLGKWLNKNSSYKDHFFFPEGSTRWGRVICITKEKTDSDAMLKHIVAPAIDTHTMLCYKECRKIKIFLKCLGLVVLSPMNTLIKTIYHLSTLGIFVELGLTIAGFEKSNTLSERCVREIEDVFCTPYYGVQLFWIAFSGVFKAIIDPVSLYDTRKDYAKVDLELNWGDKKSVWINSPCFQPFVLRCWKENSDIGFLDATAQAGEVEVYIRRNQFSICDPYHSQNTPFISAIIPQDILAKAASLNHDRGFYYTI
jgi:hypothetical protein